MAFSTHSWVTTSSWAASNVTNPGNAFDGSLGDTSTYMRLLSSSPSYSAGQSFRHTYSFTTAASLAMTIMTTYSISAYSLVTIYSRWGSSGAWTQCWGINNQPPVLGGPTPATINQSTVTGISFVVPAPPSSTNLNTLEIAFSINQWSGSAAVDWKIYDMYLSMGVISLSFMVNQTSVLYGAPIALASTYSGPVVSSGIAVGPATTYPSGMYSIVANPVSGTYYPVPYPLVPQGNYTAMVSLSDGVLVPTYDFVAFSVDTPVCNPPTSAGSYITVGNTMQFYSGGSSHIYNVFSTWSVVGGSYASINASTGIVTALAPGPFQVHTTYTSLQPDFSFLAVPGGDVYKSMTAVAAPTAADLTSSLSVGYVTNGTSFTLYPMFWDGTGVIDHGIGAVLSTTMTGGGGYSVTQASNSSATYTLTVTNLAGSTATKTYGVVHSIAPPAITGFTASSSTISIGGSTTLTPSFTTFGGTQTISGVGSIVSGVGYTVSPTATTTYTLSVSNAAGTVVTSSITITVVNPPTLYAFTTSSPLLPVYGATINLTPVFFDGTCTVGTSGVGSAQLTSSAVSGAVLYAVITAPTTFTATVTNSVGTQVSGTQTFSPQTVNVAPPSPTSVIGTGQTRAFTAAVSGAANTSVSWSHSGVSGSWAGNSFTPSAAGTVRITATSIADPSKSNYSDISVVDPPTVTLTTSNTNPLRGTTGIVVTPTHNGTSAIVGTSPGDNSISSSATTGVPITVQGSGFTTTTTYWVRAYNAAGLYTDASVTITVQTVAVTVSGANSFPQGGSGAFSVSVSGAVDTSVTWSVDGGSPYGTFSSNIFTAPTGAGVASNSTLRATSVADVSKSGSKTVSIQTVGFSSISPIGASLSTGATQTYTATITGATDTSVTWSTTLGTINSMGLYTAPSGGGIATITATSVSDPSKNTSTTATITAAPTISSFSSSISGPLVGQSYTITPVYSNGTGVIDHGIGALASGIASGSMLAGLPPVSYLLTVTNSILVTTTNTLTVTPQTVGVGVSPSAISINGATTQQFLVVVSGAVNTAVTWSVDGGSGNGTVSSTGLYTSPSASPGHDIIVRATSVADPSKSSIATVTITTIVVTLAQSSATVTTSSTFSTTATVTGTANTAVTWSAIGGGIVSGSVYTAPSTPGTYTLRATSVADPTKHADCSITVVRMPVIGAFTSSSLTPLFGSTVVLTGIFGDGTGSIDNGIGAVTSGVGYTTPPLNVPITYTLAVTNAAGTAVTRSVTMVPTTLSITVNPASYVAVVNEVFTFTATVLLAGAGSSGKTWSATGGSIDPDTGVWTAPATPTAPGVPIIITATSVADPSKTSTSVVTVVYPIYSGKKSALASS